MRNQMEALTQSILTSARERQMVVADSRVQTARMLQTFSREREVMAQALKSSLVTEREVRSANVCALLSDACVQRAAFAKAHRHMARVLRSGLTKDRRNRSRDVAEMINNFHESRGEMAQALSESLAKTTQNVRSYVSGLSEWRRVSHQKSRDAAAFSRQIPNFLSAAQSGGAPRVPSSVFSREPEERQEIIGKKKVAVAKSSPSSGRILAKPKKR